MMRSNKEPKKQTTESSGKDAPMSIKKIIIYSIAAFIILVVAGYLKEWYF